MDSRTISFFTSNPTLRDGVEVFIYPPEGENCRVLFLFLANRRRLQILCKLSYANLLQELAKDQSLELSLSQADLELDNNVKNFLVFLTNEGIITLKNPLKTDLLPTEYIERYKRQIYFLLDIVKDSNRTILLQKKIFDSNITLIGLGAVGSSILQQLCMMGFRKFTLIDYSSVEENDIARTSYDISHQVGMKKIFAARDMINNFSFEPIVTLYDIAIITTTKLESYLKDTSLIINTADEPYIGYINIYLSRYCLQNNIPLMAAGGFDAHLASLGELLLPYITPCADCYATFFQKNLKDWKPITHPVQERRGWFGGLGSLSTFSAGAAALEILSYFLSTNIQDNFSGGRGEFLFHNYHLDTFSVERDINCSTCGEK